MTMSFTVLKKTSHCRELIRGTPISPSPNLLSYCYLNDCSLSVVDFKTESVAARVDGVQDFIWREGVDGDELVIVSNKHDLSLYSSLVSGSHVKKQLQWTSLHEPETIELLYCNASTFVFLINKSHLASAVLISDALETVWCLESPCDILKVRVLGSDLHVLTLQGSLFAYDIKDGSQTAHWELQEDLFDLKKSSDFCVFHKSETAVICVGHTKLYTVRLRRSVDEKDAPKRTIKSRRIITGLLKGRPSPATAASSQLLLDTSIQDADQHVMWMPDDRHLILCCGAQGLQKLATFELDTNGVLSLVPCESGLPEEGSFSVVYDTRSTMGHAPAFLFSHCTATLTFGAATRRLLAEVMERTGTRAAETLSQLNQWQVMAVDLTVLLRGVQNRQLDMVSFFLKAKEDALAAQLSKESEPRQSSAQLELLSKEAETWSKVLQELTKVIRENSEDLSSKLFSQQLLQLLLSSLVHLLTMLHPQDMNDSWTERAELRRSICKTLASYLSQLRSHVHSNVMEQPVQPKVITDDSTSEWDRLTDQEVILKCVRNGNIPEGQYHLLRRGKMFKADLMKSFQEVAEREALQCLSRKDIAKADRVLGNVGYSSTEKLKEMLMLCRDRVITRLLKSELSGTGVLSSDETRLLEKSASIDAIFCDNKLWACSAATRHRATAKHKQPYGSKQVVIAVKPCQLADVTHDWDMATNQGVMAPYCRLAPSWLKFWDSDTIDRVLTEGRAVLASQDNVHLGLGNESWRLFLEYGLLEKALASPLPCEAVEETGCMMHIRRQLLGALAREGHVDEDTLEDFEELLGLLGEAGLRPSQLAASSHGAITPEDFVHRMVHFCLQHKLYHLLYLFLKDLCQELPPLCPRCNGSFVSALREHWYWMEDPNDAVKARRAMAALAKCLPKKDGSVDPATFFAMSSTPSDPEDISLYQLLQKGTPFETGGLFGWQSTNVCQVDSEGSSLPHFSQPSLRDKFGLREELGYTYYLHKGRPCAATFKFLAQEILQHGCLFSKRIRGACNRAWRLAERNTDDMKMVASSVAFAELLGTDSRNFRLNLRMARLVFPNSPLGEVLRALRNTKDVAKKLLHQGVISFQQALQGSSHAALDETCSSGAFLLHRFACEHGLDTPDVMLRVCAASGDWLGFLLWAQLLQLPRAQVLELVPLFEGDCLREHLTKALSVVSSLRPSEHRRRDLRASLYARIGLQAPAAKSQEQQENAAENDALSVCSNESIDAAVLAEQHYSSELMELVLQCSASNTSGSAVVAWERFFRAAAALQHQTPCLLAGCCPDAPMGSCLALWLQLCLGTYNMKSSEGAMELTLVDLQETMEEAVRKGRLRTLHLGLQLFLPESILVTLVELLIFLFLERDKGQSASSLENLRARFAKLSATCTLGSGVGSRVWLKETLRRLLNASFALCRSHKDVEALLHHCASLYNVSNLIELAPLLASLSPSLYVGFDWSLLWAATPAEHARAVATLVALLNEAGHFASALQLARAAQLPLADVAISQLELRFDALRGATDITFWDDCDKVLKDCEVDATMAYSFLKSKTEMLATDEERHYVGRIALRWLQASPAWPSPQAEHWEARVWLWCIRSGSRPQLEGAGGGGPLVMPSPPSPGVCETLTDPLEIESLKSLIDELLSQGQFRKACQLSSLFGSSTPDLDVLLTCVRLAQQMLTTDGVDQQIMSLVGKALLVPLRKTSMVVLSPAWQSTSSYEKSRDEGILKLLEQLATSSSHSQELCQRVLVMFNLSLHLQCSYEELALETDPISHLGSLLSSNDSERILSRSDFALAKKVIVSFKIPDEDVAKFLFRQAMTAIRATTAKRDSESKKKTILDSWDLAVGLCNDPCLLGNFLLKARAPSIDAVRHSFKALSLEVELCVRAHNCFLEACSMEGISRVLHRCHRLTPYLVAGNHFNLLVSLLTGMARYSEMTYVFDLLQQHHRFELLFQKGMEKVPYLRVALLDYLKHRGCADTDLYSMLTLNFNMHREIAENLESAALKKMNRLSGDGPMTWSVQEQQTLDTVMQDLADAAESYVKAECLLRAQACARQAQLVALQLRYFKSRLPLLNLTPTSALSTVAHHPNFFEADMIAEAYGLQGWHSAALFQRLLLEQDWEYLRDLCSVCELTPENVQEIALKYEAEGVRNEKSREALEHIIERLPCLESRLQLSKRLGFSRLASKTLQDHSYLCDRLEQDVR
ncbi:spatacsin isoform X2 [Rhipicephalus microplus]|uniref:spatacsin isoform X2 n=1 Tax=Rhipicephalus microplus TaxID=6941 RepID=UPI003F6C221C